MTEELEAGRHDAVILDLAARLLDTARSLKFAVKADMVDDYDFQLLQSELQQFYRDAGKIASSMRGERNRLQDEPPARRSNQG